jgi:hypothetical protein
MKRILLTSTALVAFAGAATADVSWSGSAGLGYNDNIEDGFFLDGDIDVTLSQELDNGVSVAATFGFELTDGNGPSVDTDGFNADNNMLLSVTSDSASLFFGDTAYAAETYWSGVTNMEQDGFSEADGETVLRGEMTFGSVTAGISYVLDAERTIDESAEDLVGTGDLEQLSVGATADLGNFAVGFAYQEAYDGTVDTLGNANNNGDFVNEEVMGIFASTTFSGADVSFAYASKKDGAGDSESSTGIEVAYPIGDVTATVFYVSESATDDNYGLKIDYASGPVTVTAFYHDGNDEDAGINVSYDVGNGLNIYAGGSDDDGQYIGAEYDLGGGASLTASFADDAGNDEIGPQEYLDGTTVAVSFSF